MLLINRLDGIGLFAYHTLKRLTEQHPEVNFIFFFDRPWNSEFIFNKNIKPIAVCPRALHPIFYHFWFQYSVRYYLNKFKPDLFLSPDGLLSLNAKCKQLSVIHDINFAHSPKDLPFSFAIYFNRYFPKFAKRANRIATVSEFSKNDIVKTYNIDPNKIDVIYNGVDQGFAPISSEIKTETRKKFADGYEYLIFVGSIHPRKNIGRLLQAFDNFKKETKSPLKLLIVGSVFWGMNELNKILNTMAFKKDVTFTGRLNDEDLKNVLASAFSLVYVPYFEGFGVPLVEAMQTGIPVICSNTSSLPEIAGDAALYFDPFNIDEITKAIVTIAENKVLRNELSSKGIIQSKKFTWEKTSNRLWESIQKTINQ
jgi:glycosyltransferase involved in cell wall biosynthesis